MKTAILLRTILLYMLPISELRGALPYAFFSGVPLYYAIPITILANFAVSILIFIFLDTLNKLLLKIKVYKNFFDKFSNKARIKVAKNFEKYEYIGLVIFVGIPLPFTGIWTGAIGSWILNLDRKKVYPALFAGVCIASIIVTLILVLGLYTVKGFKIFLGKSL